MSDTNQPTTSIIKSDCTGRARYTRQSKQEDLAAFETKCKRTPPLESAPFGNYFFDFGLPFPLWMR